MTRKRIPKKVEAQILAHSRRRCCICYGLDRDSRVMQGQIAHLDKNSSNNKLENLAFLCLVHHDQYDSKTSQSKGLTKEEISIYRSELQSYIESNFSQPININEKVKQDIFSGLYSTGNENSEAKLEVTYLGGNKIHVKGIAFWGKTSQYGPNIGQLDFVSEIEINKVKFLDHLYDRVYSLELEFKGDKLSAMEKNVSGYFGMNVSFTGQYNKSWGK